MPDESPSTPLPPPQPETYELSPRPPVPKLPGSVALREDVDTLVDAVAADLYIQAQNCVRTFGDFHLALSGGSTPVALYNRLMIDPNLREFPWTRTHLWIVDERRVPFDDDRSNYKMISEILGDHSGIPAEQVHPIFAMADDADVRYTQALREVLGWREKGHDRLDYVLLGMGNDAHTASLFPNSPALLESIEAIKPRSPGTPLDLPLVRINAGPTVTPPDRVTMMLPLINASRFIGVMVTGSGKRETIRKVAAKSGSAPYSPAAAELPILGVRPLGGELRWYLDFAACPDVATHP